MNSVSPHSLLSPSPSTEGLYIPQSSLLYIILGRIHFFGCEWYDSQGWSDLNPTWCQFWLHVSNRRTSTYKYKNFSFLWIYCIHVLLTRAPCFWPLYKALIFSHLQLIGAYKKTSIWEKDSVPVLFLHITALHPYILMICFDVGSQFCDINSSYYHNSVSLTYIISLHWDDLENNLWLSTTIHI